MIVWKNPDDERPNYEGRTICWCNLEQTQVKVFDHGHLRIVDVNDEAKLVTFDATDEVFAKVANFIFKGTMQSSMTHYKKRSLAPAPGRSVIVARGRTPNKGKVGVVFAIAEKPYMQRWKTTMRTKLGIALGDAVELSTSTVTGRVLTQPADRIWEWAHNCDVMESGSCSNVEQVRNYAYDIAVKAVEKLKYDMSVSREMRYAACG